MSQSMETEQILSSYEVQIPELKPLIKYNEQRNNALYQRFSHRVEEL